MSVDFLVISILNGVSYGLLLFMLSSGLTLILGMMGVLNFAHASFYMLGAYFAYQISLAAGFWSGLVIAPLLVGGVGALVERFGLRPMHRYGHVAELLFTFGLAFMIEEAVHLIWGRAAVDYRIPEALAGTAFSISGFGYSRYRLFMMAISVAMLVVLHLTLSRTRIGLVIKAALTHPAMVEALGHNVPKTFTLVFAGGAALAGIAGVIGGNAFVTEPGMAAAVGSIVFVVVVFGGMGSLKGAFIGSLLVGILQTLATISDLSLRPLVDWIGVAVPSDSTADDVVSVTLSQMAPMIPYALMIVTLVVRPQGLFGRREIE